MIGNFVGVGVGVEESNGRPSNVAVMALENGLVNVYTQMFD